jgi:hypothetical protein
VGGGKPRLFAGYLPLSGVLPLACSVSFRQDTTRNKSLFITSQPYLTNYRQYAKVDPVGSSKSQVLATFRKRSLIWPRVFLAGQKHGVVLPYEICREGGKSR